MHQTGQWKTSVRALWLRYEEDRKQIGNWRTGAILWNQISPNWRDLSKPIFKETIRIFLFETLSDRDEYVEVGIVTQVLKFNS